MGLWGVSGCVGRVGRQRGRMCEKCYLDGVWGDVCYMWRGAVIPHVPHVPSIMQRFDFACYLPDALPDLSSRKINLSSQTSQEKMAGSKSRRSIEEETQNMGLVMAKQVSKALDKVRKAGAVTLPVAPMALRSSAMASVRRSRLRHMSVRQAVEWAFGAEHARLDFDVTGVRAFDRVGVSQEWILAEVKRIGCRVDGGGQSACHADAELIAAAVEAMPVASGGRQMAVLVAACARAGMVPDWRGNARPRIVPLGWDLGEDGQWQAHTRLGDEYQYTGKEWRVRRARAVYCPVRHEGGAASVSAARRTYLDWCGAMLHIAHVIGRPGYLSDILLTDDLPPLSPWCEKRI